MAEMPNKDEEKAAEAVEDLAANYKVSARVSVSQMLKSDANDASLNKYKASLGLQKDVAEKIFDESNPNEVILTKLIVKCNRGDDKGDIELTPSDLKKGVIAFTLKEGCPYQLQLKFQIQREMVSRLAFKSVVSRVVFSETNDNVIGSFAPGKEYTHTCAMDTAPKGMMYRGKYSAVVTLYDDDKTHLTKEYSFKIDKKW